MANTLKFGNGEWYGKKDTILAYNDENNNYKPLPFSFSRASSATRVNKDGLIETVGTGEPRIDFKDNTKGSLLLEPTRTNNLLQSNQFDTTWSLSSSISLTSGQSGVGGSTDAWLLKKTDAASRYINQTITLSSSTYSYSVFAKKESGNWLYVRLADSGGSLASTSYFDLENGVVGSTSADSLSIHSYNNGWYRCEVKFTHSIGNVRMYPAVGNGSPSGGSGGEGIYIQHAQLESGSYSTSVINTSGSAVTRLQDDFTCNLPDTDSFNSSSGFSVITKFGIGQTNGSTSVPFFQFNDDTSSTYIGFGSNQNDFRCRLNLTGTSYLNTQNAPRTQENNLFISCDSNGWSQGANGSVGNTGTNDASVFDRLSNITINVTEVYGIIKIREILIYNTRLSNSELQALTQV